jgi:predicted DNA-binding mobile mystery protein A
MSSHILKAKALKDHLETIRGLESLPDIPTPVEGWVRATRTAMGLSMKTVGDTLGVTPQAIHQLERSEVARTVSLKQLDAAAAALGCRVVIAMLPLQETLAEWVLASSGPDPAG